MKVDMETSREICDLLWKSVVRTTGTINPKNDQSIFFMLARLGDCHASY